MILELGHWVTPWQPIERNGHESCAWVDDWRQSVGIEKQPSGQDAIWCRCCCYQNIKMRDCSFRPLWKPYLCNYSCCLVDQQRSVICVQDWIEMALCFLPMGKTWGSHDKYCCCSLRATHALTSRLLCRFKLETFVTEVVNGFRLFWSWIGIRVCLYALEHSRLQEQKACSQAPTESQWN